MTWMTDKWGPFVSGQVFSHPEPHGLHSNSSPRRAAATAPPTRGAAAPPTLHAVPRADTGPPIPCAATTLPRLTGAACGAAAGWRAAQRLAGGAVRETDAVPIPRPPWPPPLLRPVPPLFRPPRAREHSRLLSPASSKDHLDVVRGAMATCPPWSCPPRPRPSPRR